MTNNNKKFTTMPYIVAMIVLSIGLISFGVNNYRTAKQLDDTKAYLTETQEVLKSQTEQCIKLNEDLETANIVINTMKDEEYVVGMTVTNSEIDMLAKTVWGEARGCGTLQQSAVIWCILNRVDAGYGTIAQVITAPGQFHGYHKNFPVEEEIKTLVEDVIQRWLLEKTGCGNVGRTLPKEYLYFSANNNGTGNVFRDKYGKGCQIWNWDCWNPYS